MKLIDILRESNELELKEKRRNPEVNYEDPIFVQIKNFIEKNGEDESLIFVSFRNSLNTTLINPKNMYNTPTGLYTYPWENYFKIKFIENINNKFNTNFNKVVPFAGDRKYIYLYKLKSTEGLLRNDTTYEELEPYVQKLYSLVTDDEHKKLIDKLLNNPNDFYNLYVSKSNRYIMKNVPVTWLLTLLYDIANSNPSTVSKLFRSIGVNGLVDYGTGFIHPAEPYQAVFFRGRNLFEKIDYVDLSNKKGDEKFATKYLNDMDGDKLSELIEDSNDPDNLIKQLLKNDNLETKFSERLIHSLLYTGSELIRETVVNNLINNHNLLENLLKIDFNNENDFPYIIYYTIRYYNEPEKIIDWVSTVNRNEIFGNLKPSKFNTIIFGTVGPERVIDKLFNIKEFKDNVFSNEELMIIILYATENVEKYIKLFATSVVNRFGSDDLVDRINTSTKFPDMLKYLINYDRFIFNLDNKLSYVLENIENPINVINKLLSNHEYLIDIDDYRLSSILKPIKNNPQEVENIINKVIDNFRDNKSNETVSILFVLYTYTYDPIKIKNTFNNSHQYFISDMSVRTLQSLLISSPVPDKLVNIMGEKSENLYKSFDKNDMIKFLENSREPERLFSALGEKGENFINELPMTEISNYLVMSFYPDKIISTFGEKGKNYLNSLTRDYIGLLKNYLNVDSYLNLEKIFKKYRPDLFNDQLQENINRIKRLIL